jgi:hypothetical protein
MRQVFLLCAAALLVSFIFGLTLLSHESAKMSEASPIYGSVLLRCGLEEEKDRDV